MEMTANVQLYVKTENVLEFQGINKEHEVLKVKAIRYYSPIKTYLDNLEWVQATENGNYSYWGINGHRICSKEYFDLSIQRWENIIKLIKAELHNIRYTLTINQ